MATVARAGLPACWWLPLLMLAALGLPAGVQPSSVTADVPGPGEHSAAIEQPAGTTGIQELLGPQEMVVDVQVVGNRNVRREKIAPLIRTRPNRPFDPQVVEEDVRRLMRSKLFSSVRPLYKRHPNGRVVIFEVVERATIQDVLYVGNEQIRKKTLAKEAGLKPGDAMDPFSVEEARKSLENYYHRKGFTAARVSVLEGDRPGDTRVVFLINEGRKQKVLWVRFVGNTIASDARLRTIIQSKPPFLYLFKGEVNRQQIDEDVERLTAYYRSLGFFRARIGRELEFNENQNWLILTFIIDEGPRYHIRNVSFVGNTKISTEQLQEELKLKPSQPFNQAKLNADVAKIQEKYGSIGYVLADVNAETRFLEEPGWLDLVYKIKEGERYRVGLINVQIKGDNPHTRRTAVLNQLAFKPGEIVDIRKIRDSERKLRASQLFLVDPVAGNVPRIVFSPPEVEGEKPAVAGRPKQRPNYRGQSPDDCPAAAEPVRPAAGPTGAAETTADRELEITVYGEINPAGPWEQAQPPQQQPADGPSAEPPGVRNPGQENPLGQTVPLQSLPAHYQPAQHPATHSTLPTPQIAWPVRQSAWFGPSQQAGQQPSTSIATAAHTHQPRSPGQLVACSQYTTETSTAGSASARNTRPAWMPQPAAQGQSPQPAVQGPAQVQSGDLPSASGQTSTSSGQWQPPPPAGQAAAPTGGAPAVAGAAYGGQPAAAPEQLPATAAVPYDPLSPQWSDPNGRTFPLPLDIDVITQETQTGRLMLGVGINSDAGLIGSIMLQEDNFDITRWPTSWQDFRDGRAFRGAGQRFRLEAVPGTQVSRYTIDFRDPYLFNTEISFGISGFFYDRLFREWDEQRLGGRVSLGYHFTHRLTGAVSYRGEKINVRNPVTAYGVLPELDEVLGDNALHGFGLQLAHDTRDSPFLATQGHLIEVNFEQVIGSFSYPRVDLDLRRYFLLHERPDGSGRHVINLSARMGISGGGTPIYDHYFAGGFSTLRGFSFRGVSPQKAGVLVGGHFVLLASAEYMFPISADDMLRGVVFCDTGAVQESIDRWHDKYRVSPGFGFRITIPAMGPAPLAFDFAFPVSYEPHDRREVFAFFLGVLR